MRRKHKNYRRTGKMYRKIGMSFYIKQYFRAGIFRQQYLLRERDPAIMLLQHQKIPGTGNTLAD